MASTHSSLAPHAHSHPTASIQAPKHGTLHSMQGTSTSMQGTSTSTSVRGHRRASPLAPLHGRPLRHPGLVAFSQQGGGESQQAAKKEKLKKEAAKAARVGVAARSHARPGTQTPLLLQAMPPSSSSSSSRCLRPCVHACGHRHALVRMHAYNRTLAALTALAATPCTHAWSGQVHPATAAAAPAATTPHPRTLKTPVAPVQATSEQGGARPRAACTIQGAQPAYARTLPPARMHLPAQEHRWSKQFVELELHIPTTPAGRAVHAQEPLRVGAGVSGTHVDPAGQRVLPELQDPARGQAGARDVARRG